eukprot:SAG31_NODE_1017_length_10360_cov_35.198811_4_plen_172_part_00
MVMLGANLAKGSLLNVSDGLGFFPNLAVALAKLCVFPILGMLSFVLFQLNIISMCDENSEQQLQHGCPDNSAMWSALLVVCAAPTGTALVVIASSEDQIIGKLPEEPNGIVTTTAAVAGILRMQYLLMPVVLTVTLTGIIVLIAKTGDAIMLDDMKIEKLNSCGVGHAVAP